MDIDAAVPWKLKYIFRYNLTECGHNDHIGFYLSQPFKNLRILPDFLRLTDRDAERHGRRLDRPVHYLMLSSSRTVRLRNDKRNLVARPRKRPKRADSEVRRAHKHDFLLFFILHIVQIALDIFRVHMAVQMIDLVAHASGKKLRALDSDLLHITVQALDDDVTWSRDDA